MPQRRSGLSLRVFRLDAQHILLFTSSADSNVDHLSICVDSTQLREDDRGGDILRALFDLTGMQTVPQVFVNGALVGGATEVLTAAENGDLMDRLNQISPAIPFMNTADALWYLPAWVKRPSETD